MLAGWLDAGWMVGCWMDGWMLGRWLDGCLGWLLLQRVPCSLPLLVELLLWSWFLCCRGYLLPPSSVRFVSRVIVVGTGAGTGLGLLVAGLGQQKSGGGLEPGQKQLSLPPSLALLRSHDAPGSTDAFTDTVASEVQALRTQTEVDHTRARQQQHRHGNGEQLRAQQEKEEPRTHGPDRPVLWRRQEETEQGEHLKRSSSSWSSWIFSRQAFLVQTEATLRAIAGRTSLCHPQRASGPPGSSRQAAS